MNAPTFNGKRTAYFYDHCQGVIETPESPKFLDGAIQSRKNAIREGRLTCIPPDEFDAWKQANPEAAAEAAKQ